MATYSKRTKFVLLLPLAGILLFTLLYTIATFLYPGGSSLDPTAHGFNWVHNYWCELTDAYSRNGSPNAARPVALLAMLIICVSVSIFWFQLPTLFSGRPYAKIIRFTGILSMIVAGFIFTGFHDVVIDVAGLLAGITLSLTFIGLYQGRLYTFFIFGLVCLAMMLFNYFIHKTGILLPWLAVAQKVTFVFVVLWITFITIHMYHKAN